MTAIPDSLRHPLRGVGRQLSAAALAVAFAAPAAAQPPIVHPGPPGEPARELSADQAIEIADTSYSPADVEFLQDMIPHHHQALEMAELVADRTNRPELIEVAGRIDASQKDEIEFMQRWLSERGERVPDPTAHDAMHTDHKMAGMATPEQMAELAAASGIDFDRLFLKLMIAHHEGAVKMVEELLEQPGSAYDPTLFEFTSDVTNDQEAEIERMNALLVSLSDDPRAALAPGFRDAGQAISNLELVAALPKPPGFFDPANPAGLPPDRPKKDGGKKKGTDAGEPAEAAGGEEAAEAPEGEETAEAPEGEDDGGEKEEDDDEGEWRRSPLLSFANTDIAFAGDVMVAGNYHGFNVYRLSDDGVPELRSSVVCPGGQGDVSIVGHLLIMSVEQTRGRVDCGLEGVARDVSDERFRGLRIFDISDLERPVQVGAVQTCRGSHTHSVVSGPHMEGHGDDDTILVYNSGTSSVREEEELPGCYDETPGDPRTALFRIDVIEIPVERPAEARVVASPAVFADPETGILAGLWRGGDHGDHTQRTRKTDQCHDITVFPERGIAGGACSGNGILFDISDPLNPRRIDEVVDRGFAYWHSATFNNDGTKIIFTDEWGGGMRPRCRAYDPLDWGADAIYDIVDGKLEFRGYYKMPAPQLEEENCVAHNGSIIPVPGRDIFVQAWYQGGLSVVDFTDSARPVEIAFFDRGPLDEKKLVLAGFWSTYWYRGRIYGTEIARGIDVLKLVPSEHLSESEIAAAALADYGGVFNPQQQLQVTWPAEPVVARAYLDQLRRSEAVAELRATELETALARAERLLAEGGDGDSLAAELETLAASVTAEAPADEIAAKRRSALGKTLRALAARLPAS
ncbi:MAG: DUF305 domain-containing protein [Thermoanaerobaculia bacterium]|nr:DUF305 domain-containing protein [Thermoanaerobaculia bacterium]